MSTKVSTKVEAIITSFLTSTLGAIRVVAKSVRVFFIVAIVISIVAIFLRVLRLTRFRSFFLFFRCLLQRNISGGADWPRLDSSNGAVSVEAHTCQRIDSISIHRTNGIAQVLRQAVRQRDGTFHSSTVSVSVSTSASPASTAQQTERRAVVFAGLYAHLRRGVSCKCRCWGTHSTVLCGTGSTYHSGSLNPIRAGAAHPFFNQG
mmetsp:Transcript_61754/g.108509  ORF Transcript_61754/g.108509 Transcript_61754/m.108509 type:complete len:205 (-) Transcript_61754:2308-2922(-)